MLSTKRIALLIVIPCLLVPRLFCQTVSGQSQRPPANTFTLKQAIDQALANYPAVRAALERVAAAHGAVSLAFTSYLPHANTLWQSNRATANNIFGLLLPQSVISPITGPVLSSTSNQSVWGSAAGVLFSWEPVDFGYRRAAVNTARASEVRSAAELSVTRLDVAVAATEAFITLLAAKQTVRAAQADVDRREVLAKSVHVLVTNELRPGADASRADAELARARTVLARAQQQQEVSRAVLADFLGLAGTEVDVQPGPLLDAPPESTHPAPMDPAHPVAVAQQARIDEVRAREHVLDRSYYPRFDLQSTVFGRGSGANPDGSFATGSNGLGLERSNWAVGITVSFPLFDVFSIRARKRIEGSNERAEAARYDQTIQDLTGQLAQAKAALEGARQVAADTPVELQAARDTETQARARYQAGLATIVEVAEAQGLLVQADIDDSLARLAVWHNLASIAAAEGNLEPFLQLLH